MKVFQSVIKTISISICLFFLAQNVNAQAHHHHHADTNSIDAKMRKIFYGMQFYNVFDNNKMVDINSMPSDTPILIMYFSTDCGHCRLDAQKIPALVAQYDIPFWMASNHSLELMNKFADDFKLRNVPNLLFLQDFSKGMHNWFEFRYVPFFALIDKKGNFIKEFEKLPSPEELREVIRTNEYLDMFQGR